MASNFKKIIVVVVVIIIIAIIILFLWVGIAFFGKDNSLKKADDQQGIQQVEDLNDKIELTEEERVKTFAENFVIGYGSYQKGSFLNLKEAQKMMTNKYREETARFIEEKEKEQNNTEIKEYISYTSIPTKTTLTSLDPENANVLIDFEYNTFYGAFLYLSGTLTAVDRGGNKITQPLKREMIKKQATILIIKENGLWKVDNIKID